LTIPTATRAITRIIATIAAKIAPALLILRFFARFGGLLFGALPLCGRGAL